MQITGEEPGGMIKKPFDRLPAEGQGRQEAAGRSAVSIADGKVTVPLIGSAAWVKIIRPEASPT